MKGGIKAEEMCDIANSVWSNSIYKESDVKTDKFTRPDGFFVSDFNVALENYLGNTDTMRKVTSIEQNRLMVKELILKLQDPPEELEKCFDMVSDLNAECNKLMDLACYPEGTLKSFQKDINSVVSDFMTSYEKLNNLVIDKKQKK